MVEAFDSRDTVIIIGGGITGLAAAYTLQQEAQEKHLPLRFILVEAEKRLGGKITTDRVDGFTIEGGPDCYIRQKPWAGELCRKLGLGSQLIGTNDEQRKVYVVNRGRLTPLPDGVMLIVPTRIMPFVTSPLISWPGKLRMGMDLFLPPFKGNADESVGDFVRRRLGQEALEKIAEPLMSGIHVSDPEQQSLLGTFPRFRALEQNHGSLIQGMLVERRARAAQPVKQTPANGPTSLFVSLQNGMAQMVEALQRELTGGRTLCGVQAQRLERLPEGGYQVDLSNGERIFGGAVILATPAYVSARLLQSIDPQVSSQLARIRYVSTATISLAYRKDSLHRPFMGFGFVIPKKENRRISACTWTSYKFNHRAPDDHLLLRCFVGGPGKEEQVELEDAQLLDLVKGELRQLLDITAEPVLHRIYRWRQANPQYDVGHLDRVREIRQALAAHEGLYVTGSAYEGVGVPDCIHQGQKTALNVIDQLRQIQQPVETAA